MAPNGASLADRPQIGPSLTREPGEPSVSRMLIALTVLLIVPRVDFVTVSTSSIRLEDVLLALMALTAASCGVWSKAPGSRGMAWVTIAACVSALLATLAGAVALLPSLLYALRPIEYWSLFVWLWARRDILVRRRVLLDRFLFIACVVHVGIAAAQVLGNVSFGFSKFSYERGAGLTAGPYELGAMVTILLVYWVHRRRVLPICVCVLGLLLSASRVSLLGALVAIGFYIWLSTRAKSADPEPSAVSSRPRFFGSVVLCAGVGTMVVLVAGTGPIGHEIEGRVEQSALVSSWRDAAGIVAHVPTTNSSSGYIAYAYDSLPSVDTTSTDPSAVIRFGRWQLLGRIESQDARWLLGLGPSFAGPSVDGGILRIFVETGVVGLAAWCMFIWALWKRLQPCGKAAVVAMTVGSLFIDQPFAMRVVLTLLTVLAICTATESDGQAAT